MSCDLQGTLVWYRHVNYPLSLSRTTSGYYCRIHVSLSTIKTRGKDSLPAPSLYKPECLKAHTTQFSIIKMSIYSIVSYTCRMNSGIGHFQEKNDPPSGVQYQFHHTGSSLYHTALFMIKRDGNTLN